MLSGCHHGAKTAVTRSPCEALPGLPERGPLLFGEMHGSVETPALISQAACVLSQSREVAVGLEIPTAEQPRIDAYLASRGTAADRQHLLDSGFWQRNWDGRSSAAMLRLIDDIRALKQNGAPVEVFVFDDQPGTTLQRDVAIANGIRRFHTQRPTAQIVALMGNVHARQEPITLGNETIVPAGKLLGDLKPVSILVAYPKGKVWACMPECGVQDLNAAKNFAAPPGFRSGDAAAGYNYTYSLPSMTAAAPAVEK